MSATAIAFGPVPSRRLGRSLGVNNIPPKHCSYSCVYCQVGRTEQPLTERRDFYPPEQVASEVASRLRELAARGERVDMITFVPDGEPTLDRHLGRAIELVRGHSIPVAVITNATLIDRPDVRADLARADWICLKVDTVDEPVWRRLNRPATELSLASILAGARAFAREFGGTLVTDTMLIRGLNELPELVRATARFVAELAPSHAYLGIPTRPTAEPTSAAPSPEAFDRARREFSALVPIVETLTGHGTAGYGLTGDVAADLRAIAAVHPMREAEVRELVAKAPDGGALLARLVATGELAAIDYRGERFYVHRPAR